MTDLLYKLNNRMNLQKKISLYLIVVHIKLNQAKAMAVAAIVGGFSLVKIFKSFFKLKNWMI